MFVFGQCGVFRRETNGGAANRRRLWARRRQPTNMAAVSALTLAQQCALVLFMRGWRNDRRGRYDGVKQ